MGPLFLLLLGMTIVVGGILLFKIHPVIVLLAAALVVSGLTSSSVLEIYGKEKKLSEKEVITLVKQSAGERVAVAFGSTCGKIGLLIILASIIGKSLLETGAAEKIVRATISLTGAKQVPASMMASSFVLAGPVFFDTVFYLMVPLARAMGVRSQKSYPLYIMGIVAGGTMAHSLVPPTPGPLFVAAELGVSFGLMAIMGGIVGLTCATSGLIYASWLNKRQDIPLRNTTETSIEDLQKWSTKEPTQLPGIWISVLPIALPVFLITGDAFLSSIVKDVPIEIAKFFDVLGNPIIALSMSAMISLVLLYRFLKGEQKIFGQSLQEAIYSSGIIILITASGGAFGTMLQQ
ncbi:MAG: GntP family permease, partial [Bacteroidia bacterium]|nr:GntP family permease [Bacteroidia bacterium]